MRGFNILSTRQSARVSRGFCHTSSLAPALQMSLSLWLLCLFSTTARHHSVRLCVCLAKQLAARVICFLWQLSELSLRACCSAEVEHLHQK